MPWGSAGPDAPWSFTLGEGETAHLPSGVYWFSSWEQNAGSQVILDGYVRILLTDRLDLRTDARVNPGGSPYDLLIFAIPEDGDGGESQLRLAGRIGLHGLVYAHDTEAHLSG